MGIFDVLIIGEWNAHNPKREKNRLSHFIGDSL